VTGNFLSLAVLFLFMILFFTKIVHEAGKKDRSAKIQVGDSPSKDNCHNIDDEI